MDEERDENTPLWEHMLAGSIAGMVEHAAVFPIDTVKTHVQAASAENVAAHSTFGTARMLINTHGFANLFRGLSALMPAIGPAHALMFSGYEQVLYLGGARDKNASAQRVAAVGACAGVVSTVLHDSCMVPAETIKQRLQLGYYKNAMHCAQAMLASGGGSFYRSLPTTLAMNVPYGCVSVAANEALKATWSKRQGKQPGLAPLLACGGVAGALASLATTPLDVIKTRLQTQNLVPCRESARTSPSPLGAACAQKAPGRRGLSSASAAAFPFKAVKAKPRATPTADATGSHVVYRGFADAAKAVYKADGPQGFYRGATMRALAQAPSVAIVWTTYEMLTRYLAPDASAPP